MVSSYGAKFDRKVTKLRGLFPASKPIKIKTYQVLKINGDKCSGCSSDCGDYWLIQIERSMSWDLLIDTLIHEFAHIIDLERHGWPANETCHSCLHRDSWGETYAEIYRRYTEEDFDQ